MNSVRIRSCSGPHFPAFGQNTDQNNSEYGHFLRSDSIAFAIILCRAKLGQFQTKILKSEDIYKHLKTHQYNLHKGVET